MADYDASATETVRKMLWPTSLDTNDERDGWGRYHDADSGYDYLYNPTTGESRWLSRAVDEVRGGQPPDVPKFNDRLLVVFETCCCEQPTAFVETLVRAPCYLCASAVVFGVAIVAFVQRCCDVTTAGRLLARALLYFREAMLFLACAVTLAVPCTALVIYRTMPLDTDEDWDVQPLPTLLGHVDPRRFWAFTLGRTSNANNGDPLATDEPSLDYPWTGPILHPPSQGPSILPCPEPGLV